MPTKAATQAKPVAGDSTAIRLVVPGASGFIGSRIIGAASGRISAAPLSGRQDADIPMTADDVVITCALHPLYRSQDYDPTYDLERTAAEAAARVGARVIMLSTRRVYPAESRWGARETDLATGDETPYGRNKARTEAHLIDTLGDRVCILRLSNVFGFEYQAGATARASFFGLLLSRLKAQDEVYLDVGPETRRDFVPAEWVAEAVVEAALAGAAGVFNIGGGTPLACGEIARQVIAGYGRGSLHCAEDARDEFYLDTSKWVREFGRKGSARDILDTARQHGIYLRHA